MEIGWFLQGTYFFVEKSMNLSAEKSDIEETINFGL